MVGLYDTVFDVDHDKERADAQGVEPNGFSFDGPDAAGVDYALNRCVNLYLADDWENVVFSFNKSFKNVPVPLWTINLFSLFLCVVLINDVFRAISAWYDGRDWFNSLCKTVMEQDWSWNKPALDYMELYHAARK